MDFTTNRLDFVVKLNDGVDQLHGVSTFLRASAAVILSCYKAGLFVARVFYLTPTSVPA
jgi:hypothetical protein